MKIIIAGALCALLGAAAYGHPADPAAGHGAGQHHEATAMASAARAFLATLDDDQRGAVSFALDDDEARNGWSNLPTAMAPRQGLSVAGMGADQRIALHGLLARVLSSEGYGEAAGVMWLDDQQRTAMAAYFETAGDTLTDEQRTFMPRLLESYDSENFYVRIFGDPVEASWGFALDGHHLAINATVVDGRIAYSPVFLGASPQTIEQGRFAGRRAFQHELDAVGDLVASLSADQTARLTVSGDIADAAFAGTGWTPDLAAQPLGIAGAEFTSDQVRLLWRVIEEFIGVSAPETAAARLTQIQAAGLDTIHVAWWGDPADLAERFMVRVTAPSLHIDMTREGSPGALPNNHVHIIVRDPTNEFGAKWLQAHYAEAHGE